MEITAWAQQHLHHLQLTVKAPTCREEAISSGTLLSGKHGRHVLRLKEERNNLAWSRRSVRSLHVWWHEGASVPVVLQSCTSEKAPWRMLRGVQVLKKHALFFREGIAHFSKTMLNRNSIHYNSMAWWEEPWGAEVACSPSLVYDILHFSPPFIFYAASQLFWTGAGVRYRGFACTHEWSHRLKSSRFTSTFLWLVAGATGFPSSTSGAALIRFTGLTGPCELDDFDIR